MKPNLHDDITRTIADIEAYLSNLLINDGTVPLPEKKDASLIQGMLTQYSHELGSI